MTQSGDAEADVARRQSEVAAEGALVRTKPEPVAPLLVAELGAMLRWASSKGRTPPADAYAAYEECVQSPETPLEESQLDRVVRAHRTLSRLVRPARPDTILSLEYEKTKTHSERRSVALFGRWYRALGPLPVVRRVVLLSIIFLLIFVAFATSQNARNIVSTPIDAPTTTTVAANTDDSTPGG